MRTITRGLSLAILATLFAGCTSTDKKPAPVADSVGIKAFVDYKLQSAGSPVLQLTVPGNAKSASADGSLSFTTPDYAVQFWLVPGATTVDEGVAKVATQIASEFKDFKPEHTSELTVAGSPAKQLFGTGHEADDGDEGSADLIVFKVGSHVFVACNHGENLTPDGQRGLLAVTQTAKLP